MSDWEDDDFDSKPKVTMPPLVNTKKYNNDEWDDEPTSHNDQSGRHYNSNRSDRGSDKRQNNNYMDSGQDEQMSFTVNKSNVGLIIGRGGSKIKDLQQKHRVHLDIGKKIYFFLF